MSFKPSPEIKTWLRDDATETCYKCTKPFTVYRRRHHCRCCGMIFCSSCSNHYIKLESEFAKELMLSSATSMFTNNVSRVCKKCLYRLARVNAGSKIIESLILNQFLNISDYKYLRRASRLWKSAIDFLLTRWKRLQRDILLLTQLTSVDKLLLKQHAELVLQHPILLCRYYQAFPGQDVPKQEAGFTCKQMMCRESCNDNKVRQFCCIVLHLPQHTDTFKMACALISSFEQDIVIALCPFLLWICLKKPIILTYIPKNVYTVCFWYCRCHLSLNQFKAHFETEDTLNTESFICLLLNYLENRTPSLQNQELLEKYVKTNKPLLPYEISSGFRCQEILFHTRETLESATEPIIIKIKVVQTASNNTASDDVDDTTLKSQEKVLMYKKESLETDFVIQNTLRLLKVKNVHTSPYYVAPLEAKICNNFQVLNPGSGLILFESGLTLKDINDKYNQSLCQYVMESNPTKSFKDIRDVFIKTCAAQSIVCLLFQVGDRHLRNILIKPSGELYNIDFSFLWSEPIVSTKMAMLGTQQIRITQAMLGLIGNQYTEFEFECQQVNRILRQNIFAIFCIAYSLTQKSDAISVYQLQQNFEQYLCSSVTNYHSPDLIIKNILKASSSSSSTSIFSRTLSSFTFVSQKASTSIGALKSIGSSLKPIIEVNDIVNKTVKTATSVFALRSLFGLP